MNWTKYPKHLRALPHWPVETRRRVEILIEQYGIDDPPGMLLLHSFANAESREIECRIQIERDGQTILDRFGQAKPHPLLSVERDSRAAKLQALKALNFDSETTKQPGRPSGGLGI